MILTFAILCVICVDLMARIHKGGLFQNTWLIFWSMD